MKKHIFPAICILFALMLISFCAKVNDRNPQLFGKWTGIEWVAGDGTRLPDAEMVRFEFSDDGNYTAQLGEGYSEVGVWRNSGEKLYTTATGKSEKVVKVVKLDAENLSFEMNRQGRAETLTLKKVVK